MGHTTNTQTIGTTQKQFKRILIDMVLKAISRSLLSGESNATAEKRSRKKVDWKKWGENNNYTNNGHSPLMAHKLLCLTTHFAQFPIHHANLKPKRTPFFSSSMQPKTPKRGHEMKNKRKNTKIIKWYTIIRYTWVEELHAHTSYTNNLRIVYTWSEHNAHWACALFFVMWVCNA